VRASVGKKASASAIASSGMRYVRKKCCIVRF
jgi:hypothetical protein